MDHNCGNRCLGPLTFHTWAVGDKIHLTEGCRRAERNEDTFRGGVVFSNRPVRTCEKIRVMVERKVPHWKGAMRVGFTNIPPSARSLPLPCLAMPNLTKTQGHWATPVPESCCEEGLELEFWVSACAHLSVRFHSGRKQKLPIKVDLSRPLWAMIDAQRKRNGSSKKDPALHLNRALSSNIFAVSILIIRHSMKTRMTISPALALKTQQVCLLPTSFDFVLSIKVEVGFSLMSHNCNFSTLVTDDGCVVCMGQKAEITLPCGHRCLCPHCSFRVLEQFGTCPLCRLEIITSLVMGT
ncbi:hypothetical protein GOODEAATRI_001080 [Goodea atripinnis]|uniref:RING-type domain-containing protein n=1 Tax=Goodea atripinnis TaxID=208336 RepID=A0ABV0P212_9TELE